MFLKEKTVRNENCLCRVEQVQLGRRVDGMSEREVGTPTSGQRAGYATSGQSKRGEIAGESSNI